MLRAMRRHATNAGCATVALLLGCGAPERPVAPTPAPVAAGTLVYAGELADEGHFRVPGEVRPYHTRWVVNTDAAGGARLDVTAWDGSAATADDTDTTWLLPRAGAIRDGHWLDADDERDARAELAFITARPIDAAWTATPATAQPTALVHR